MKICQSMWIQWPFFFQKLEPKVMDPQMTFDPKSVEVTCVMLPKDPCVQVPWEYINVCGYSDQFCKIAHTYTYILHTSYTLHTTLFKLWLTFCGQYCENKKFAKRRKLYVFQSKIQCRFQFWSKKYKILNLKIFPIDLYKARSVENEAKMRKKSV